MVRKSFDLELQELNLGLHQMCETVLEAFRRALVGLRDRDTELLAAVVAGDKAVNAMEKDLESRSLRLLMRQQPVVGADLRAVSAALGLTTDLERLGDQAQDIADIGLAFCRDERNPLTLPSSIGEMGKETLWMLEQATQALEKSDLEIARQVEEHDDVVDELFRRLKEELVEAIKNEAAHPDDILDLLMIGKYLERIADHSVNVCEWVCFYKTGRHQDTRIV